MGALTLDGVFIGGRPFHSIGHDGQMPTIFDVAARDRKPPIKIDYAELIASGRRAYRLNLAKIAARAYRKNPELLNRISWGMQFQPAWFVLKASEGDLPSSVNRRGLRIYARWLRRVKRAAVYAEAAE